MTHDVYAAAARLRAEGTPFVLATVVASYPPQSVRPGAKAIVYTDGTIEGWVGGGCVRPVVMQEAADALRDRRPRLVRINAINAGSGADAATRAGAPPRHDASTDAGQAVREYPMTCQGEGGVEVYLEPVLAAPRLVVLGQTPVAQATARLGVELGFEVVAAPLGGGTSEIFPPDVRVAADAEAALAGADQTTWVVVATMGAGDEEAIAAAAASAAAYVGLVASRKKARHLVEYARASGVPAERLERVKFPAGLDLGGMSAPEIALSILAEIVQRRYAVQGRAAPTASEPAPRDGAPSSREGGADSERRSVPGSATGADASDTSDTSDTSGSVAVDPDSARGAPPENQATSARPSAPDQIVAGASAAAHTAARDVEPPAAERRPPGSAAPRPRAESREPRALSMAPFPLDPICGMPVNPAEARHTLVVGGETLYFCCPHCKAAYERQRRDAAEALG